MISHRRFQSMHMPLLPEGIIAWAKIPVSESPSQIWASFEHVWPVPGPVICPSYLVIDKACLVLKPLCCRSIARLGLHHQIAG